MPGDSAIAIFVKTPGLSPIKSRLAKTSNPVFAHEFYQRSVQVTQDVIFAAKKIMTHMHPYWAVAEEDGLDSLLWTNFPVVWQGPGTLGDRLCHIHRQLLKQHKNVALVGADAPLLTPELIINTFQELRGNTNKRSPLFILGPAYDGGFYLFASNRPLKLNIWRATPYSCSRTLKVLYKYLSSHGRVFMLPPIRDIDTVSDIFDLLKNDLGQSKLIDSQKSLITWLRQQVLIKCNYEIFN